MLSFYYAECGTANRLHTLAEAGEAGKKKHSIKTNLNRE